MSGLIELLPSPEIDENLLAAERLENLRGTMLADGLQLLVLTNPVSIRYATGYRAYSAFQSRIPSAYAIVPLVGPIIMHGAYIEDLALVEVSRRSHAITSFDAGLDLSIAADRFAADIERALTELGYDSRDSIGIERTTPTGHRAFADIGLNVFDAEPTIELARSRKSDLEMVALDYSIAVAEYGMTLMERALEPGVTENQLFALLHQTNIAHDGDWIDGRMLCSGPRTNPWYQEASHRTIEQGDMVAFDTDMIGPYGYCADISRTWVVGDKPPSDQQRRLYDLSRQQLDHNIALLRPGVSFTEYAERSFPLPEPYLANRYADVAHGCGLGVEYPLIWYPEDAEWGAYDGHFEENMVVCVESYIGKTGGREGVKLEQPVWITADGPVVLADDPLEDDYA